MATKLKWKMTRIPGGYRGTIALPDGAGGWLKAGTAVAKTKGQAISKAASLAARLAADPTLREMLPPGTTKAIKVALALGKAAKAGKLAKKLSKVTGKGAKRLAKALKFW